MKTHIDLEHVNNNDAIAQHIQNLKKISFSIKSNASTFYSTTNADVRVNGCKNEGAHTAHAKSHVNSNANIPITLTLLDDFQKRIA